MQSWQYEINDVLWINYNGSEQVARVAGYVDSLDNTTPLLVNLRVADGQRWGSREVKIQPSQIVRADPEWQARQHAAWEASIKKTADESYAKMSPEAKQRLHEEMDRRRRRSPIDVMIDRACGLE